MTMQNIEHVVVLMLENRSFDSMLGWLYAKGETPALNIPNADPNDRFRGMSSVNGSAFVNQAQVGGQTFSASPTRGVSGVSVPQVDPGEEYEHVLLQFYDKASPGPTDPITMTGVLQDFVDVLQERGYDAPTIMAMAQMCLESFTPAQLPVLNQLARHYAVSDAWYASMPSQTNPNRAFLMCGTSMGMVNNGDLEDYQTYPQLPLLEKLLGMKVGDDRVDAPTVFNALNNAGADWEVFWQTSYVPQKISTLIDGLPILIPILAAMPPPVSLLAPALAALLALLLPFEVYLRELATGDLGSSYTWRLFPQIQQDIPNAADHFHPVDEFHRQARAGTLPKFSYIEPFWSIAHVTNATSVQEKLTTEQGNDYHPPSNLFVGEQFVKDVYTSLISNRAAWQRTALLITFDEFVGTFDHISDDLQHGKILAPVGGAAQPVFKSPTNFDFERLGARVPTILISPYVQEGTVFRSTGAYPYDHTSVLATVLDWIGQPGAKQQFGARAQAAPTFDGVFTLDQPRTDEQDLAFLDKARALGDPVGYGETINLRNQDGDYITGFYRTIKLLGGGSVLPDAVMQIAQDLGVAASYPTVGEGAPAPLSFVTMATDPTAAVTDNAQIMIVSREEPLRSLNLLYAPAGTDSYDCYYCDEYLDSTFGPRQHWTVQKSVAGQDQTLHYGDQIVLMSVGFPGQMLTHDWRLGNGEWLTTSTDGVIIKSDRWTVLPAAVGQPGQQPGQGASWNGAPKLVTVAASQQGGSRGAQLWGVDEQGQLRSAYQESPGGSWSSWSGVWNGSSPSGLVSVAAAQQNDGRVQLWVVDGNHDLFSVWQTSPGGDWVGWTPAGWNGAPKLVTVAASQQGGSRGAQLWGVDEQGQLRSAYQESPGGSWSTWSGVWNGSSPSGLVSVAAAQQNDGRVQLWVVDGNHDLFSVGQTSPGGDWVGWTPAGWNGAPKLVTVAASQQGGSRGAQLWGVDEQGQLRSAYQESPGGSWSSWSGVWNGSSPSGLVSVAAAQQNDGRVQLWVVDGNHDLFSVGQTSPGGDWAAWTPTP
ncbi:alkaline phosphatase family protein [Angustibacter sp. McL0619]|uniref:alkaline phosphatase family protein n=1 Tax=Angustibacter sp. McL0619 TaxID=3415676 RepID=UPI003CF000DA